jgi:hypothetical protein
MNEEAKVFWKQVYMAELARGKPAHECASAAHSAIHEGYRVGLFGDGPQSGRAVSVGIHIDLNKVRNQLGNLATAAQPPAE